MRWRPRRGVPVRRIRGVSAATRVAIRKFEDDRLYLGCVAAALAECRRHLDQPGRRIRRRAVTAVIPWWREPTWRTCCCSFPAVLGSTSAGSSPDWTPNSTAGPFP